MTTIAAIEHDGRLYIGADGRANSNGAIVADAENKLLDFGAFIFGICGAWRGGTVLRRELVRGASAPSDPWAAIEWYRDLLIADGWEPQKDPSEAPRLNNGGVLVWTAGVHRGVYDFCSSMSLTRVDPGWPATSGSGSAEASGALLALLGLMEDPLDAVMSALEVASRLDAGTGGMIRVEVR